MTDLELGTAVRDTLLRHTAHMQASLQNAIADLAAMRGLLRHIAPDSELAATVKLIQPQIQGLDMRKELEDMIAQL